MGRIFKKINLIEVVEERERGVLVQNVGNPVDRWEIPWEVFRETYEELKDA